MTHIQGQHLGGSSSQVGNYTNSSMPQSSMFPNQNFQGNPRPPISQTQPPPGYSETDKKISSLERTLKTLTDTVAQLVSQNR